MSKLRDEIFMNVKSLGNKQVEVKGMVVISFAAIGNDTMAVGAAVEQAIRAKMMKMLLKVSPEVIREIASPKNGGKDGSGKN